PEYRPTAGAAMPEQVSVQGYRFEVEKETQRARVVVDYTYPDQAAFGLEGGSGPEPSEVQLPGLKYDEGSRAVVLDDGGKKTVCAKVESRNFLFWKGSAVTPTGACVVTSSVSEHKDDTGWNISRKPTVDTYLEIR